MRCASATRLAASKRGNSSAAHGGEEPHQHLLCITHQGLGRRHGPGGVQAFDVHLHEGLPLGVEQRRVLVGGVGGAELVPTASTRSAAATTALAASRPKLPNTPSASGCVSGNTPFPDAVVATGMPSNSASSRSWPARGSCARRSPQ